MMIQFYKYQGTGNDFIILDNRKGAYENIACEQLAFMCNRKFGIGADGLMMMNAKEGVDFEMRYFNADGKQSTMCGNGGRCMIRFAFDQGMHKMTYRFIAIDGLHEAEIDTHEQIRLKMTDVNMVNITDGYAVLNTGSPHYVKHVSDMDAVNVIETGRSIRNQKEFFKDGINVNFVETLDDDSIYVRTYERGVEDETLSCGTGVTAAALMCAHNEKGFNRVEVKTLGGKLSVEYNKISDTQFEDIWLCGPATFVFKGEIQLDV